MQRTISPVATIVILLVVLAAMVFAWVQYTANPGIAVKMNINTKRRAIIGGRQTRLNQQRTSGGGRRGPGRSRRGAPPGGTASSPQAQRSMNQAEMQQQTRGQRPEAVRPNQRRTR